MAKSRIRYRKSSKGTIELMTSPQMRAVMVAAAENAKPYAEAISEPFADSRHYIESFRVTSVRRGGPRHDRAEARLVNVADYGAAVESRHQVLGHTVDYIEGHGG